MNNPIVSVITPVYNTEKFIAESIESILSQTYKNFEFIIVDDASTDSTWDIVQKYAKRDKRIKAFRNKKNLYIAANRNEGLKHAKGKYVVWQDADDISVPTRLEKQVSFMEEHSEVGICGGYLQSFMGDEDLDIRTYSEKDEELRENIFKYSPVAQPAAIIRKSVLDNIGRFNESLGIAEDLDLSFRIGKASKFANLPEVLIRYREHPNSSTYKYLRRQILNTVKIRKKYSNEREYKMSLLDRISNRLSWIFAFFPAKFTIGIFKFYRRFS